MTNTTPSFVASVSNLSGEGASFAVVDGVTATKDWLRTLTNMDSVSVHVLYTDRNGLRFGATLPGSNAHLLTRILESASLTSATGHIIEDQNKLDQYAGYPFAHIMKVYFSDASMGTTSELIDFAGRGAYIREGQLIG